MKGYLVHQGKSLVSHTYVDGLYNNSYSQVQVDETKIGKRKYNVGRVIEGHWVLGLIESDSPRFRVEILGRGDQQQIRDMETFTPLISKHVLPGTKVGNTCLFDLYIIVSVCSKLL
jgi:hypothetical protein